MLKLNPDRSTALEKPLVKASRYIHKKVTQHSWIKMTWFQLEFNTKSLLIFCKQHGFSGIIWNNTETVRKIAINSKLSINVNDLSKTLKPVCVVSRHHLFNIVVLMTWKTDLWYKLMYMYCCNIYDNLILVKKIAWHRIVNKLFPEQTDGISTRLQYLNFYRTGDTAFLHRDIEMIIQSNGIYILQL